MWQFYFSRKYSLLRWVEYLESLNNPLFLRVLKVKKTKLILNGYQTPQAVYYQPEEYNRGVIKSIVEQCLSTRGWKSFSRNYWQAVEKINRLVLKLQKLDLKKLSNYQLLIQLNQSRELLLRHFSFGIWGIFVLEPEVTSLDFLKFHFPNLPPKELTVILTPSKLATHFQEEYLLGRLKLSEGQKVARHLKNFGWIPCVDLIDKPWTKKDLIIHKKALRRKGTKLDFEKKESLPRYQRLVKKLSVKQRKLADLINQVVYLKDHRDDVRFRATFFIRELYMEIARRLKFSLKELTYLTDDEVINLLRSRQSVVETKNKIQSRLAGYVIRKDIDRIDILTGKEAKRVLDFIIQKDKNKGKSNQISGLAAMAGRVKGRVVIVKDDPDLKKVKEGSIIVAVFTRPHYLLAMRKAKAIITDEGGLTSHAAIVSRELKIPCIVGTKTATSFFKDGDRIEVDATRGVIKKL